MQVSESQALTTIPATPKNVGGRPTLFSPDMATRVCEQIALGKSLRTVCAPADMPSIQSIYLWMSVHPGFSEQYARAKEDSAEALAEEILDIADDTSNDWIEDDFTGRLRVNQEHIQRSRLRVDSRKWIAAKLKPKKYGDHADMPVAPTSLTQNNITMVMPDHQVQPAAAVIQLAPVSGVEDVGDGFWE